MTFETLDDFLSWVGDTAIDEIDKRFTSSFAVADDLPAAGLLTEPGAGALHSKLRGARCEEFVWSALLWKLKIALPDSIAADLIDRRIAVRAMAEMPQSVSIRWRLAEIDSATRAALLKEAYTRPSWTAEEFGRALTSFGNEVALRPLIYLTPDSVDKAQAFSSAIKSFATLREIAWRSELASLVRWASQSLTPEQYSDLYRREEPEINAALAVNLETPLIILNELGKQKTRTGTAARVTLRQLSREADKRSQRAAASVSRGRAVDDLAVWDSLSNVSKEEAAVEIGRSLPNDFAYVGLATNELGGQKHAVATFTWKTAAFVLIPGCEAILGRESGFPNWGHRRDWTVAEFDLQDVVDESMTNMRKVRIAPFLMEVASVIIADGEAYERVLRRVERAGFRLPTSDEWEYACGAGERSLFRWGTNYPKNQLPIENGRFTKHLAVNAFGLRLPSSPYDWELVDDPQIMRGGDGGMLICGGASNLAAWLPLATAFFMVNDNSDELYGACLRRVRSV